MSTDASKGIPQTQILWLAMVFVILLILISITCYIFSFITRWLYKRRILDEIQMINEAQKNVQNVEMLTDLQSKLVTLISQLRYSNSKEATAQHQTSILPQTTKSREFSFAPISSDNFYRQQKKSLPKVYQVDETTNVEFPKSANAVREQKKQVSLAKTPPAEREVLHTAKRKKHKHKHKKSKGKNDKRKKSSESSMQTTTTTTDAKTTITDATTQTQPTTPMSSTSSFNTLKLDRSRLYFDENGDDMSLSDEEEDEDEAVFYDDLRPDSSLQKAVVYPSEPRQLPEFDTEDLLSYHETSSYPETSSFPDEVNVEVDDQLVGSSAPPEQAIEITSPPDQEKETTLTTQQTSALTQKPPEFALDEVTPDSHSPPVKSPPKKPTAVKDIKSPIECLYLPKNKNLLKDKDKKPTPESGFVKSPVKSPPERQVAGFAPDYSTSDKFSKKIAKLSENDRSKKQRKSTNSGRNNPPVSLNPYWRAETTCNTDYDHIYSPSTGHLKAIVSTAEEKTIWYPPNKTQNKKSSTELGNPLVREQFFMPKKHTAMFCNLER